MSREYFKHMRIPTALAVNTQGEQTVQVSERGGITMLITPNESNNAASVVFALTNRKDNFCKRKGRAICTSRAKHSADNYTFTMNLVNNKVDETELICSVQDAIDQEYNEGLNTQSRRYHILSNLEQALADIEDSHMLLELDINIANVV